MRYRIKIITYKNGRKEFIPQFKTRLMWVGMTYDGCIELFNYPRENREDALYAIDKHYAGNHSKQTIEFEYINKV